MKTSLFLGSVGLTMSFVAATSGCSTAPVVTPNQDASGDTSSNEVATGPICPTVDDDLISDFKMDNGVHPVDGRAGGWYTYGDKSGRGALVPAEGGGVLPDLTVGNPNCPGDPGSLHVKAVGYVDWGAATGVDFMPKVLVDGGSVGKGTYDASRYRGVSFWAKATAPVRFVQVSFKDPYSDLPSVIPDAAAHCVYDATMKDKNCSPYIVKFGYGYTGDDALAVAADYPAYASYKIDQTWKRFQILFAETKQDRTNPGLKSPGDKLAVSQLTGMAIQANSDHSTTPPTANDFEIWIDDVTFIK